MRHSIVGIGEVLWDLFPDGPQLGGAPTNFAYHAQALGASASVITRTGKDRLGDEIRCRFEELGLSLSGVQQDDVAPTGTVTVTLEANGIPTYVIAENVAWDYLEASAEALNAVREARAICFGSLAQRHGVSRQSIQRLVANASSDSWRVFDINLRQGFFSRDVIEQSLELANVLKLNGHELEVLSELFGLSGGRPDRIRALAARFGLEVVALTCGAEGALIYRGGKWAQGAAPVVTVKDTVGAGDAFTAVLCLGLVRELDIAEINGVANLVAAFVCGCQGATPVLPPELRRLLAGKVALPT